METYKVEPNTIVPLQPPSKIRAGNSPSNIAWERLIYYSQNKDNDATGDKLILQDNPPVLSDRLQMESEL